MFPFSILLTIHLLTNSMLFGQQLDPKDYRVYSAVIRSEILKTTQSVTIINKLKIDTSSAPWVTGAIKSKDTQQLEQLRFLTRDDKGNSVGSIDTMTQNLILGFYQSHFGDSTMANSFDLKPKVFLVDNSPFNKHSRNEWQDFYRKYPGSGGLFQFSNVYYSQDQMTAILYHSLLRNGLNGHGVLTILTNSNGIWKTKYQIVFWQA